MNFVCNPHIMVVVKSSSLCSVECGKTFIGHVTWSIGMVCLFIYVKLLLPEESISY